jgi:hypothetical protein
VHYHKPVVVMLVGYLTPEAVVPQALLYNKTERGSFFAVSVTSVISRKLQ